MLSKTELLWVIFVFYAIIIVLVGFAGQYLGEDFGIEQNSITENARFSVNFIKGFSSFPSWVNAVLFVPLGLILLFALLTSFIPTLNGGD